MSCHSLIFDMNRRLIPARSGTSEVAGIWKSPQRWDASAENKRRLCFFFNTDVGYFYDGLQGGGMAEAGASFDDAPRRRAP